MLVLVLNPGSSSLKYAVWQFDSGNLKASGQEVLRGAVERIGESEVTDHAVALESIVKELSSLLGERKLEAIGHRVVHGGRFTGPVLIDSEVIRYLELLNPLAPLHNVPAVLCIHAATRTWPQVSQVAVFDTSFHRTLPEHVWRYALPQGLCRQYGIRRYGFHGISVEHVGQRAARMLGIPWEKFDGVIAHLGNGASVTAVHGGQSVDTSMGFTPLEGLVMGTRSGDVDPGILIFLLRQGLCAEELDNLLNRDSGLKALAGDNDMRTITTSAATGDKDAQLALETAAHRLVRYIGGYHVTCGGANAIVLTGGIGENSAPFRTRVLEKLAPLGVKIDPVVNETVVGLKEARVVSAPESSIPVLVVPTDEQAAIAKATVAVVSTQ
ncbi:acetate/propionate family kinase [Paeniglutamicibacter gangotriensis]|uniref:Acetate kinase n=1 Tax=Paeniglutamicibacter gangotriensis TaxID=254787 RepID=A0A5B0E2X1_9MICC|nr:acetate kinase [Paeniglutamicibacter gangotriensis]KAA0973427.1 acetate kinase [Paeniglutamicibacter gangotriensis]